MTDITAARLAEIMQVVPAAAWPKGLRVDWNQHGPTRDKHWYAGDGRCDADIAVLLCEASMVRWLTDGTEGVGLHDRNTGGEERLAYQYFTDHQGVGPSRIEALAALCKEVADA